MSAIQQDAQSGHPYRLAILASHPIQYFAPLYRRLAQEPAVDLTVYFCSRQGLESRLDRGFGRPVQWDTPLVDGYEHRFLGNIRQSDNVGGFFSLANPGIIRELARGRYDALWVHGHNYATNLAAIAAAKLLGIPVLMRGETHPGLTRAVWKETVRRPLMQIFYHHLVDGFLSIGTRNESYYTSHGVRPDQIFRVPYVVDNSFFARGEPDRERIRGELGLPSDLPVVLFASQLAPRKRLAELLEAYRRLRAEGMRLGLLVVGSGPEEERLRRVVRDLAIPDVIWAGFRNQSELPALYAASDVFVFPSVQEPWGLVLNEAMSAGLPVIVSEEIGAAADLVRHGESGFLFPGGDVDALTERLRLLVQNPDLRRTMGERSRQIMENWDIERCVQGVLAALRYVTVPAAPRGVRAVRRD